MPTTFCLNINNDNTRSPKADASIRRVKGLECQADSLVQVRLADETMLTPWQQRYGRHLPDEPDGDERPVGLS